MKIFRKCATILLRLILGARREWVAAGPLLAVAHAPQTVRRVLCVIFARLDGDTAFNHLVKAPERTTAAAFPRYSSGEVLADSASLQWPGLFVRRSRFPRAVDRFLVPATPEPLMSCVLAGSAEFQERKSESGLG